MKVSVFRATIKAGRLKSVLANAKPAEAGCGVCHRRPMCIARIMKCAILIRPYNTSPACAKSPAGVLSGASRRSAPGCTRQVMGVLWLTSPSR